jgi:acyl-CoA thioesterase-1
MNNNISYAEDITNSSTNENTIIILGDSLSAAYGIELEQGWVNLLRNRLQNHNSNTSWNVINASISGDTTASGLTRLPDLIDRYAPVLCIIALGANNGLRGQSLTIMRNDLDQMVKKCNEVSTSLLIGMKLPANYGEKYTHAFHQIYVNVAKQNNISLVPFLLEDIGLKDEYFQADRLHPTAEAQPLILENIWPVLENVLSNVVVK